MLLKSRNVCQTATRLKLFDSKDLYVISYIDRLSARYCAVQGNLLYIAYVYFYYYTLNNVNHTSLNAY